MSDGTKISWADATWNPVIGCTKVSAGCDNCYAIRTARRMTANDAETGLVKFTYTGRCTVCKATANMSCEAVVVW